MPRPRQNLGNGYNRDNPISQKTIEEKYGEDLAQFLSDMSNEDIFISG